MEPADGFWDGMGIAFARSPWWAVVGAVLVIGVLFIVARYIVPSRERIKARELDIRERESITDQERVRANAALAENMRGLRESNDMLAQQAATLAAGIEESKLRSRAMGDDMTHTREAADHIKATTDETNSLVKDIRRHVIGGEGID